MEPGVIPVTVSIEIVRCLRFILLFLNRVQLMVSRTDEWGPTRVGRTVCMYLGVAKLGCNFGTWGEVL